jgi:hypothetical protein
MIAWDQYTVGEHRIKCPACGRSERDRSAGLKMESDGHGVVHCFRCSFKQSRRPERGAVYHAPKIKSLVKSQPAQHVVLSDWGMNLWNSTLELSGVALQYLASRHCAVPPADTHLRWHPLLKHPSGHVGPALVALVTHIHSREYLSLHRTWITAMGKANLETPRLSLANHSLREGVIRLYPDDWVTNWLGVAEGIETALSLAWAYQPVWATIDSGHLAKFPVLIGVGDLVIAQDKDLAGVAAATSCANRWVGAGRRVLVTNQIENDLNDVLTEGV